MINLFNKINRLQKHSLRQHGAVLMVMLVILVVGASALLLNSLSNTAIHTERDKITANVLAQAKEALIGFSVSVDLSVSGKRPGDLPCPDIDNDGLANSPCSGNALGRLPWKTLGLSDLRDSSGEHLWYAVSSNFKNSPRTSCALSGQLGCLNSDSVGTITIRSPDGTITNDATIGSGVVAVIIAPGTVLQRTDQPSAQDRSITGINNPINYLDIAPIEDNANFTDSNINGFVQGSIKDSSGRFILNDQLLIITQDNIMQAIQKRVAGEVKQCLNEYANPLSGGFMRYPWAAKLDPAFPVSYSDTSGQLFGRIPDTAFTMTDTDSASAMFSSWVGNCKIISNSGWWLNWKEIVFFGLADAYKPSSTPSPSCGTCLTVNPPSTSTDKKFIVIVSGKKLLGQNRSSNTDKGTLSNYLESGNADGVTPFEQQPNSPTFNDTVIFQ